VVGSHNAVDFFLQILGFAVYLLKAQHLFILLRSYLVLIFLIVGAHILSFISLTSMAQVFGLVLVNVA